MGRQYSAPNIVGDLWGLRATYAVHLRLIGKPVVDFLLVIIELFLLGAFILSQVMHVTDGQTDGQTDAHRKLQHGKNSRGLLFFSTLWVPTIVVAIAMQHTVSGRWKNLNASHAGFKL